MFEFRRNHIVVTVLVFMIAIAGYLSFTDQQALVEPPQFADSAEGLINVTEDENALNNELLEALSEIDTLAPDAYDMATGEPLTEEELALLEATMNEEAVAASTETVEPSNETLVISKKTSDSVEVAANTDDASKQIAISYFAEEKMLREQSRAKVMETLSSYVTDDNLGKEEQAKAAQNLITIQDRIEKENGAESLLRAKGFQDVIVRMDDNAVDVVVSKTELTTEEVAQIEEIVQRKTGYAVGQIKISRLTVSTETAQK